MSKFPDPVAPKWIQFRSHWSELLFISEPVAWVSHWEPRLGRARRCGGPGCALCHYGYQKQLRVVVMAIDASGRDTLIELRERHRNVLDQHESAIGLVVRMRRKGAARNSPIELEVIERRPAAERDINRLVASFGLEPLFVGDPDAVIDAATAPIADQLEEIELERGRVENPVGFEDFE